MNKKRYFHRLSQKTIDLLLKSKVNIQYILDNFKQPNWCSYPDALSGVMGCWSLMDCREDGGRSKISRNFCNKRDCYVLSFTSYIIIKL